MAVMGRSSGRSQEVAFGQIANDLQKAAFQFGAMVTGAQQLYAALNVFRELNRQLTLTAAIAGATAAEFKQMENAVRSFALGTTFTASQSANALLVLSQAGFTVQQSMSAMSGVLTLAQATLEDVNASADLVASTLTSYKLDAEDASRVSNLFAASMNKSLASLPKLAFALRQVGPVAGSMGISIEETTAALSELFNVGLRGEQAGTALRNVMVNLINPTGEAAKIIKTLGIQTKDAEGNMRTLTSMLKDLSRFNLSDTDLASLFGKEALAGGIALMQSAASGSLQNMEKEITGTQEAVRVALEQMNSLDATIRQAQNAVDEFRMAMGEQFAGTVKTALNYVTDLAVAYRELDAGTKAYITSLASSTALLGVGVPILTKTVGLLGSLGGGIVNLAGTFKQSAQGFQEIAEGIRHLGDVSPLVGQLGKMEIAGGFVRALPAIGMVTTAIVGVGGLIWAFREARKAAEDAQLDAVMGEYAKSAENITRNIKNLGQIQAGSDDFKGIEALGDQFKMARNAVKNANVELEAVDKQLATLDATGTRVEAAARESRKIMGRMNSAISANLANPIDGVAEALQISATSPEQRVKGIEDAFKRQAQPVLDIVTSIGPEYAGMFEVAFARSLAKAKLHEKVIEGRANEVVGVYDQALQAGLNASVGSGRGSMTGIREALGRRREEIVKDMEGLEDIFTSGDVASQSLRFSKLFREKTMEIIVKMVRDTDLSENEVRAKLSEGGKVDKALTDIASGVMTDIVANRAIDWDEVLRRSTDAASRLSGIDREQFKTAEEAIQNRRLSIITSEALTIMNNAERKAEADLAKAKTEAAAASGDKGAQRMLMEIEQRELLANEIFSMAQKASEGMQNRLNDMEMSGSAFADILSGKWIADALASGEQDQMDMAYKAIEDAKFKQEEVRRRLAEAFAMEQFQGMLADVAGAVPEIDAQALFAPMYEIQRVVNEGGDVFAATQEALTEVSQHLSTNMMITRAILENANIDMADLNAAEQVQLAASTIVYLNGGAMVDVADTNIRAEVLAALSGTDSFLTKAANVVKALWAKATSLVSAAASAASIGAFGGKDGSEAKADNAVADTAIKDMLDRQSRIMNLIRDKGDAKLAAGVDRMNKGGRGGKGKKRGGGGKSKEEQAADLQSFLSNRNKMIIDSALELAAFGEDYDIDAILDLRIKAIDADYTAQIDKATKEYEKMFSKVKAGSEDHQRLTEMRDREISQLEKLKEKNLEYANSAEFAAKVQAESAKAVLDKYIEMNTYTGTFFQGLAAGMQQHVLDMATSFQTGMDTMKTLVSGFVGFGNDMFAGFFEQVATGQKSMGDLLKESLRKMLMQWAKYFADLAFKYMADWVMKKALGILGGGFGGIAGGQMGIASSGGIGLYAKGGAFEVNQFASGGIVDRPRFFNYGRETKVGQMGEAGQEGVLPLKRNSKGQLGVISLGENTATNTGSTITLQNSTTISIPGGRGENDEEREMRLMERIQDRQREVALEVVADEMRVGGLLYGAR